MSCPLPRPGSPGFAPSFARRLVERRVPVAGSVELTRRCGLRCVHCYLGAERAAGAELEAARALPLLGELADAGCLFLLFTGGDPLLHPEFPRIYREARRRGMLAGVFTSGAALTAAALEAFAEHRPSFVEVSLYGDTAATHERVTGVPGSFARSRDAIERLAARGLPVEVKTVLMTLNRDELSGMAAYARERGLPFRFDAAIFPRFDGDRSPLALRLPAAEAVGIELADPDGAREWRAHHERTRGASPVPRLYACAAGETAFHVDADGTLLPCLMARAIGLPLPPGGFADAWARLAAAVAQRPLGETQACLRCDARMLCGYCPGHFGLESGSESRPAPWLCDLGRQRLAAVSVLECSHEA